MSLQLFRITAKEIFPIKKFTPRHHALVVDESSKKIYVYKGKDSLSLNEFESAVLYERIMNRFLNSKIFLIYTLKYDEEDGEEISRIKAFLKKNLQNQMSYKVGKGFKHVFLLQGIQDRIKEFKNYEKSRVWRQSLTNLSNIWKLSLFNVIGLSIVIIALGLKLGLDVIPTIKDSAIDLIWTENLVILIIICLSILVIIMLVNLAFILFPMKFPIEPAQLKMMKREKKQSESEDI
jgi:hypothetical protein